MNKNKNKHRISLNKPVFSVIELLVLLCVVSVIVTIGLVALDNSLHFPTNHNKNNSFSSISYRLPYTSNVTTVTTLPTANNIVATANRNDIGLSFTPNKPVGDIYATHGSLRVNNDNGAVTKTITIDITEQLMAGTAANQGLDIKIGNQYSYDDEIGVKGRLSPGPYQIKVRVSDTKGKPIYAYSSQIDFSPSN